MLYKLACLNCTSMARIIKIMHVVNFIKELQFLYISGIRLRCNGLLSCGKLIHWRNMDVQMMWLYSSEVTGDRAGRIVAAAGEKISCFLTLKFRSKIVNGRKLDQ